MTDTEFYTIYLPALEKALANDYINHGFHVKGPDYYINTIYLNKIYDYPDIAGSDNNFLNRVAYYFDARSHNFPSIQGISIEDYKKAIIIDMDRLKKEYQVTK